MVKVLLSRLQLALLLALLVATAFLVREERRLASKVEGLQWNAAVEARDGLGSAVNLSVGSIQFLKRGYTAIFDAVEYEQAGVRLRGRFGNPTVIWMSSVTLNFDVTKRFWSCRNEWRKDRLFTWKDNGFNVGKAQVAIGDVAPGTTREFTVLIPNVTQSESGYDVLVTLSGERYAYLQ